MKSKTRLGVVGLKGIADYHVKSFIADGRTEVVACCDLDVALLEKFGDRFSVPARYTDYEEMLDKGKLDLVLICTNETLHARMTVQAAARRPKAILCEKPIAMNLGEADEMLKACKNNNVLLIIGHQRRYRPHYVRAKKLLKEGAIGDLEQIQAAGHSSSGLLDSGTHFIDLIRFYLDDVPADWVFGQIDVNLHEYWDHKIEGASLSLIKFRSGIRAFLTMGGNESSPGEPIGGYPPFHTDYFRITFIGSQGRMEINGDWPDDPTRRLQIMKGSELEIIPLEIENVDNYATTWHRGISPQSELLDTLQDGHVHQLNGESARADLEILMAIYESSRIRRIVNLPLETKVNPFDQILAEENVCKGKDNA